MTNEIQKQYDRLEDVPSIMLRMKDVYAVPDRHIGYAATKAFFGTKMAEGSSVQSHGVKMLSLVEKLENLKAGLDNDTYIDVILQSLPPSYDPFIVNYNMNGLEKSIHELINMLVQYEATTHKSEPAVLVGEDSTSKAKGKGARRRKRKKGKRTAVTATASTGGAPPAAPTGKGKGKVGVLSGQRQMMCASIAMERGIGRGSVHNSSPTQVLQRSRRLSKDEMILTLGDGKAVAAEAMGSLRLSNSIMTAQHKRKVDNHENAQIWHARLGHISKDRIRRLVDSKNLEIDNLDHLPTCESCLKGKMTKKPFVGQSAIANSLLDLVHTDVCGPLSIPARGGFSYFITFTDDHSRYGYVYLMRYKSEAFGRFKEYRLEVENQTNRKIKALRSDQGVPQTPYEIWHGKPASYKYLRVWGSPAYVKRLVGDKLDSRSSLCRFIGYPKETTGYYFYDPTEQKTFVSRNAVFLEKGFPSDNRHDEVLIEESNEEPHRDTTTSFEPTVHTDSVPVLRRSTRESRVPDWLVTKGYTQRPGVDFEETYSPVAMAKSIRILLAIAAWYDYEIWQMDVKTTFLNGFIEEDIFMDQSEGFTVVGEEQKVCHLQRSIYGLKQASRSWNTRFDEVIRMLGDIKAWLSTQFSMKDMGEASYILGIKIYRDRSRRLLGLTQSSYIEKVLKRFKMEHSKRGLLPMRHGIKLSKKQSPKTNEELKKDVEHPLYLSRRKHTRPSFQSNDDDAKSQSGFVFKLNGGVVAWKSSKQDTTADSTTEAEYIAASEAAKEAVWMKKLHPRVRCGT
ncbi:UNVERIFIED_CONTAM: Retrovirus-related Pol polyprotein from transposon TNT 1-94 [Sesamum radiatum]|uniref:Retrovirus-related Pol polyprotein from transposon TNT 1-94 n=1 Tax=Sesamum radiatum TaxID=300843 RepID=A0AAW2RDX7_SESRA